MLMVIAKLGTPQLVGRFSLGLAITAPVITLASCQLRMVQATDAKHDYSFSDYFTARLLCLAAAVVAIFAVTVVTQHNPAVIAVVMAIAAAKALESVSDIYYGSMQQHERMDLVSKSKIIKGLFSLGALAAAIYFTRDVLLGSLSLALVWGAILIGYDVRNRARVVKQYAQGENSHFASLKNWRSAAALIWLALPLGISGLLNSLRTNIPRYYVVACRGEAQLGVFSAVTYVMVAVLTVVYGIGECSAPRLAKYYAENRYKAFIGLLLKLAALAVFAGVIGIAVSLLWGSKILSILFTPEYARAANVLVLVMAASAVTSVAAITNYAMTATRDIAVQLPIFALVCGATAAVCSIAVPRYGISGAALGLLAGAIVHLILGSAVVVRGLTLSMRNK
ncbi:MAG: lipopolysaccharide biosynthesis protein [Armatimonadota bacterium]|nr:lipopolysaccharide biosynthesis protein [Armatimonadota bacterium]